MTASCIASILIGCAGLIDACTGFIPDVVVLALVGASWTQPDGPQWTSLALMSTLMMGLMSLPLGRRSPQSSTFFADMPVMQSNPSAPKGFADTPLHQLKKFPTPTFQERRTWDHVLDRLSTTLPLGLGDLKLLTAISLWLRPDALGPFLMLTGIGAVMVHLIVWRRCVPLGPAMAVAWVGVTDLKIWSILFL